MRRILARFLILFTFPFFEYTIAQAQITGIKIAGDTCNDITLSLQAEGTSSSPYFFWEFNDPASGTNDTATFTGLSVPPFPTHTFSAPGIYNVCVSFQEPGQPVTKVCRRISVLFCCQGFIVSTDSCLENDIPFILSTTADITNVSWNFGDPASGASNTSNLLAPSHKFTSSGIYSVSVSVDATCGSFVSNYFQKIVRCSTNDSLCTGIIVSGYTCFGNEVSFDIISDKSISAVFWNFGDVASGVNNTSTVIQPTHRFSAIGNYPVKAIVTFDCGVDTLDRVVRSVSCDVDSVINKPIDSSCKLVFPNAFTPNNDNINDRFGGKFNCKPERYEMIIVNRWGEIVFKSNDLNSKWDGLIKGKEAELGVYFFTVQYTFPGEEQNRLSGDLTLIR